MILEGGDVDLFFFFLLAGTGRSTTLKELS